MQQNQQLVATMLRRMDLEEERRNKAEKKVAETAEAAKKAAEAFGGVTGELCFGGVIGGVIGAAIARGS